MPLYEYQCDKCAHRFERIQKSFSDPPPDACPKCGGAVQKLPSSPAIQFKGTGWYITDYPKKSSTDPSGGESSSSGSGGSGSPESSTPPAASTDTAAKTDKPSGSTDKPSGSKGSSEGAGSKE
jgi:putative FmdB family regulatory protein